MVKSQYKLVNPYIEGEMKTSFSALNNLDAAKEAWETLSKNFTNNLPKFAFTLQKNDGSLSHYLVKETADRDTVNFSIEQIHPKLSKKKIDDFKKRIKNLETSKNKVGGENDEDKKHKRKGKHDDDDSSSSCEGDDSDLFYEKLRYNLLKNRYSPIVYWSYTPYIYQLRSFFMPTFLVPQTPFVHVHLDDIYII